MADESDDRSALQNMVASAYKPREPIPFAVPPFQSTPAENYAKSLTPRQLLATFPYEDGLAVRQAGRELRYSRLQAVAHEAIWHLGEDQGKLSYAIVDDWVWWLTMPKISDDFWETGYLEVWVPSTIHEFHVELQGAVRLYGLRFWPEGDAFGALPGATGISDQSRSEKPPVSEADMSNWWRVFSGVHPEASEDLAQRSARAMFPDNHVSRQKVRDLRGPQKRGRPAAR